MPIIGRNTIAPDTVTQPAISEANILIATRYTAIPNDYVDQMFVYSGNGPAKTAHLAIYTFAAGLPVLRTGVVQNIPITAAPLQWFAGLPINIPLTAGVTYVIAMSGTNFPLIKRETLGAGQSRDNAPLPPLNWTHSLFRPFEFSMYANVANAAPAPPGLFYPCKAQLIT